MVAICCGVHPASESEVTVVPRRSWKCSFTGSAISGRVTVSSPAFLMTRFQTCEKYLFLNERPVLVLRIRGDACSIPSSIRRNAAVQGISIILETAVSDLLPTENRAFSMA